jgi:cell division transport system permease protein
MAGARTLPLHQDGSTRFLPWLIALMVFLAALAIGAGFTLDTALDRWDDGLRGSLTVQLPRPVSGAKLAPATLAATLAMLRAEPGVESAMPLDDAAEAALLQPWLGTDVQAAQLPLPVLVDLHLAPGAAIDGVALGHRLAVLVPGARVETHGAWLDRLFRIAGLIELGAGATVILIGSAAIVTVIFTTRTGLMIHEPIVNLLHLMGASDFYIARQFQWHAFRLGVRGGIIGLVPALLTFGALRLAAEEGAAATADLMPGVRLPIGAWLLVATLPLAMGLAGLATARITVLRALARMP